MKSCRGVLLISILCLCNIVFAIANAEIYKWVDEHGNTHYSSSPSSQGTQVEIKEDAGKNKFDYVNRDDPIYYEAGKKARHVVIVFPDYNIDSTNNVRKIVGKLSFGSNCVSPKTIRFEELKRWSKEVVVSSMRQANHIKIPFSRYNYSPITVDPNWIEHSVKRNNALLLLPVITDIQFDACADGANVLYLSDKNSYGGYTYKKARIYIKVNWQLRDGEKPLHEQFTEAYVNNWDGKDSYYDLSEGVLLALEMATKNLLANKEFVDNFRIDAVEVKHPVSKKEVENDSWSLTNMLDKISGGYLQASKLTKALVLMANIKPAVVDYYMVNGEMPHTLGELSINIPQNILLENYIGQLYLVGNGEIYAELTEDFGNGAVLTLKPEVVESISTVHWSCYSNLGQDVLEKMNCKSI